MRTMLSFTAFALIAGAASTIASSAALAGNGDYGHEPVYAAAPEDEAPPPPLPLYERIARHYGPLGRDVREEYRDGPCRIERHWETDGDFEERIRCRGPRH